MADHGRDRNHAEDEDDDDRGRDGEAVAKPMSRT